MKIKLSSQVWSLAWPIMLSNISIPLLGMLDTAIVGHLPQPDEIATIALGTMVFSVLFWCFGFLRMSTTALAAQEPESHHIYYHSSFIACIASIGLIVMSPLLKHATLVIVHTAPHVEQLLASYFSIRIFSALPTLMNYVNYGFMFGRHNMRTPMRLLLLTNIAAIVLDYVLVWHAHMGADGIALANFITQTMSAIIGCAFIYKRYLKHSSLKAALHAFTKQRIKRLMTLNSNIFIRTLFLVLTTSFFTRQSAYLGVEVVAANMILMNLQLFTSYALDGFAIAAETLVGQAVGNNDQVGFHRQVRACAKWAFIFGMMLSIIYYFLGTMLVTLMTSLPHVKATALHSLAWVILLPILSTPGFLLDGIFIGATWSKSLRNAILFSSLAVFFPVYYFAQPLQNQGLWLAYTCFMLARGGYLFLSYLNRCNENTHFS